MNAFVGYTIGGVVFGAVYAVIASGLVVTYTTSGIFNFAHGAVGMLMGFAYWELRINRHWPAPIALLLVLFVLAPFLGGLIERVLIRRLDPADTGTTLVVTLGLLLALMGLAYVIWDAQTTRIMPELFAGRHVRLGRTSVSYHELITIATAVAVAIGLRLLLFGTRVGVAMRAVVDDRDLAALNGARPVVVSQLSWMLGSSLAAVGGILLAPKVGLDVLGLTFLVVNGFAAAMLGRLRNLPLTFLGALLLGLGENYTTGYVLPHMPNFLANLRTAIPTLMLFVILVALPQGRLRAGRVAGVVTPRVPSGRTSALAGLVFVAVAYVVAGQLSGSSLNTAAQALSVAIIGLSLVLLTGYGGQVSLCQYTFAGVGAFVFGKVAADGNVLGLLAVAIVAAAVGALVALPTLRLRGLYLALSTLAFARLADALFFLNPHVLSRDSLPVHRLRFPGVSFNGGRGNVVLLAIAFAALGAFVLAIRRGPFGRLLRAMSDSPAACATLGVDLTLTKLGVFALSAALAGVGGALYGGSQGSVTSINFLYIQSLFLLLIITFGGINTVSGALMGGVFLALFPVIAAHLPARFSQLPYLATGIAAIVVGRYPSGAVGLLSARFGRWRAPTVEPLAPMPAAPAAAR